MFSFPRFYPGPDNEIFVVTAIIELMQKGVIDIHVPHLTAHRKLTSVVSFHLLDSALPCFTALGEHTAQQLRERFQPAGNKISSEQYVERLIMSSLGSNWTRLYDSVSVFSSKICRHGVLMAIPTRNACRAFSTNTTHSRYCNNEHNLLQSESRK